MDGNKIRVLIIEDDQEDKMAYERFIKKESLNYEYVFANSAESARKIIASQSFDVILSDYVLGDGNSLDVFSDITDTPIIVVTGSGNEETAVMAMKMGASDYLIKDPDGFYLKTLSLTVRNAIERRKAEDELKKYKETLEKLVDQRTKKLKESEERYRTLITRMINAFALQEIICDENGNPCDFRFLDVNAAFEEMTGIKKDKIIGKTAFELIPGMDASLIEPYGKVALKGDSEYFEHYSEQLDKYFEILVYSPGSGQFATIYTDITYRKKAEEEKRLLEKQLLQTQKMEALGTLAGGIAHDFNNILSIIFGYIDLASFDLADTNKIMEDLEEMKQAANRAKDLINHILTVSQRTEHKKQFIQIDLVIKEAVNLLKSTIPSSIAINIDIDSKKTVLADSSQIHQVVINLCTNAYHAMKKSGGKLTVSLKDVEILKDDSASELDMPPGEYVRLDVTDTGHGMDDETLEKIFDPYFTTKEIGEGTGLGLAIVHGIITHHNGYISVSSGAGSGTTFHIYFPTAVKETEADAVSTHPDPPREGNERILVIDDEIGITNITSKILSEYGYNITVFNKSISAYEEIHKNSDWYDLIITDMTMPEMSGLELAGKVREVDPGKPVIICSGYSDQINNEIATDMGVHYISKPVVMSELTKLIREILDKPDTPAEVKA